LPAILSSADVAIDLTLPEATRRIIQATRQAETPLVCGVSGMTERAHRHLLDAAKSIPVLYDRNMSLSIAIMQRLIQIAGAGLGGQFEAEIHESDHVHKIDAPSGTALQLGEALAASRGQNFADTCHYDPTGTSKPESGKIAFHVERRGEVRGEHTVLFSNASESLSVTHKVNDRRVFAEGAIKSARWLVGQSPGFYSMQDVIRK
jgi:4-hydroxy-tetrahydrodipicolinate reductase